MTLGDEYNHLHRSMEVSLVQMRVKCLMSGEDSAAIITEEVAALCNLLEDRMMDLAWVVANRDRSKLDEFWDSLDGDFEDMVISAKEFVAQSDKLPKSKGKGVEGIMQTGRQFLEIKEACRKRRAKRAET